MDSLPERFIQCKDPTKETFLCAFDVTILNTLQLIALSNHVEHERLAPQPTPAGSRGQASR